MPSTTPASAHLNLAHFPVTMFVFAMGVLAFSTVLQLAVQGFDWANAVFPASRVLAIAIFLLVLTVYLIKALVFRVAVLGEFKHPIGVAYFPTIPVSLVMNRLIFPLAALTVALLSLIVFGLFIRTIVAIVRGEIFRPE